MIKSFEPPYYAVIFTSYKQEPVPEEYNLMNDRTFEEVEKIDGFLGYDAGSDEDGFGFNISYWRDEEAIKEWRENVLHKEAQRMGIENWYKSYGIKICKVESDRKFER